MAYSSYSTLFGQRHGFGVTWTSALAVVAVVLLLIGLLAASVIKLGNCQGWTGMLAAMKAWVEHGISLREGFYK